jgi:hypothetical protein
MKVRKQRRAANRGQKRPPNSKGSVRSAESALSVVFNQSPSLSQAKLAHIASSSPIGKHQSVNRVVSQAAQESILQHYRLVLNSNLASFFSFFSLTSYQILKHEEVSLMETVLVVSVVSREQQLQHILPTQLGTVHGLVNVCTRYVEQRIERQSQPVLDVVGEVCEMRTSTVVAAAIGIASSRRVDATRHVMAAVWILVRRLQAERRWGHD